ncbi:acyltransferase family protein [Streptomyces sp. NBC_00582]|uniref:acyltransferase family protein n=1 Tax=Streptomyces sp. NBC_00582 TaxID=2975783 RepID=UPI002E813FEC|nr:acyltransferase [Streptomyces sp. NBC_00582]WUB59004.1 acyltransferase [Streptomyces sp. NBC_00582]WUB67724.1 acyltransferase [Streptomyces sp. NBC_00582]
MDRAQTPRQVMGLDGLRGLAALYVVLFHCWLYTFPGYPDSSAPQWLDVLMFGRLAVVFFLVLSGFSLAISPARHGWWSGGVAEFLRRRAWRILPPYWAALVMSLIISWSVVPASHYGPPTNASILVYGLLAQDIFTAPTPNGAFWSIGVEAELYLFFPLLLFIRRRWGAVVLAACVTLPVISRGLAAPDGTPVEGDNWLAPHLAPVFMAGLIGAGVVVASDRVRRLPWGWFAVLAAAPVLALGVFKGPVWTVNHYFWIDLAIAPAMTMLLAAVATGRPAMLIRFLTARPVRSLGGFSYSLYLIHLPIVMAVIRRVAPHFVAPGMPTFCFTLILALPVSLCGAWVFSRLFEVPFKQNRSWKSMIALGRSYWTDRSTTVRQRLPEEETRASESERWDRAGT